MLEVEAKAFVEDCNFKIIKENLEKIYGKPEYVLKKDIYYSRGGEKFRVRECDGKYYYTEKIKLIDESGFEKNKEIEKEITHQEYRLIDTKFDIIIKKIKEGWVWTSKFLENTSHIELLNVPPLGYFLEIEVLIDDVANSEHYVNETSEAAKKWIFDIFDKFDLRDSIEKRKYMEMLKNGR